MKRNLCWIRRDLRLHDHHALSRALQDGTETYLVFVFDQNILSKLTDKKDKRITLIMDALVEMEETLKTHRSGLIIRYGDPRKIIPELVKELQVDALYFNRDYEPYAKMRDESVEKSLRAQKTAIYTFKDHVFYEKNEVLTGSRDIYKVFTPYKNKWLETFRAQDSVVPDYKCDLKKLAHFTNEESILNKNWFATIGFEHANVFIKGGTGPAKKKLSAFKKTIHRYKEARDIPSLNMTSLLSPYLRFGNISIRDMIRASLEETNEGSSTWLSELIWRDFYQVILDVYPKVETHCFKMEYDKIKWQGKPSDYKLWCEGKTGFPIVDAAMRCLNETGFMHNRLRMVIASFLTKTLLIDWRLGERYFAEKLLDFDLAANNGGWQWSASTGVDAQPYFRIFNPWNQSEKFDENGTFIREWCPELKGFSDKKIHYPHEADMVEQAQAKCIIGKDYPHPIVSYKIQKEKALAMFKAIS